MPKRTDIKSILVIGAGPIIIGQACEFDYSGAQACKTLREEGYRVILVNSNPATIMTDPDIADSTYIEPINCQTLARIVEKERPDALLPTMGGQTALNCALDMEKQGILEKFNVEMIGASKEAINKAEDRESFRKAMKKIGLSMPSSEVVNNMEMARNLMDKISFPVIIRPSFTLGGTGGGIAYNRDEYIDICERGIDISPTNEVLIEQSVIGWKEYEMEVVRDCKDNCIIVCAIENIDPMGVHTGDSITVAPTQTLTDKEYQIMRDASLAVLREIGVETGGSNVQFAVNPKDGKLIIIEMNPRVSRSSALASKATGFPIAKVATKLAVGYTLDELGNDITGDVMPASFEPSIDYVVTKIPRFTFEKFPKADDRLTTQMKSVGEVMAIGRNFQESLQKAIRSMETGVNGFNEMLVLDAEYSSEKIERELRTPSADRLWYVADGFRKGLTIEYINDITGIDNWFLAQIYDLIEEERKLKNAGFTSLTKERLEHLKQKGFSDARLAKLTKTNEDEIRKIRKKYDIYPIFKRVDSCAAEFPSATAYMYSSYDQECESEPTDLKKIMVLGGGPNRIGQGIEFDYCCVQAAFAVRETDYEIIMVNCNPETVSTDYDISDRLYFEPLTLENVLDIIRIEKPHGVIVQYGGQTPLKLAKDLEKAGVPIIGTSPDSIDLAEDRERFQNLLTKLNLKQPPNCTAKNIHQAIKNAQKIGYPLVVRPSYVLGGRAMRIIYNENDLQDYMTKAVENTSSLPILLDHFLDDAIEVDIDAISDGKDVCVVGIMEHIERAGVHSGDSACSLPPFSLSEDIQEQLVDQVVAMGKALSVIGLMNVQFAIQGDSIYVLEVNPRASRTVPFVSKAIGLSVAKIAVNCMLGISLCSQGLTKKAVVAPSYYCVKESVFPFIKFLGVDPLLGPEMKSTGEVMGVGSNFGEAFAKSQSASGEIIHNKGNAFISVREKDKKDIVEVVKELIEIGYFIYATDGTFKILKKEGLHCERVNKVREGQPHIVDMLKNDQIDLIVNTTEGKKSISDSYSIRRTALQHKVFYTTTITGAKATVASLKQGESTNVNCLQNLHKGIMA